ncbi:MAG: HD domain-containing protein [Vampirovibrionales bacterium]|nr:HD domain-containing protein [Vampirovibrionales bacterium]
MDSAVKQSLQFQQALKGLAENALLQSILPIAGELGATLYPVGGCVREALMGCLPEDGVPDDLDCLIISPDKDFPLARKLAEKISETFNGAFVPLDEEFGIYRVVLQADTEIKGEALNKRVFLDFSDALGNSLQQDLARRDLTINAMALDLKKPLDFETGILLDPFGGVSDLNTNTIRMVCENNLLEDPLRMLRVFRFAALLESASKNPALIDLQTFQVVKAFGEKINTVAAERIQEELYKFFSAKTCFPALLKMAEAGFLEVLFPDMSPMRDIPPNGHHHLGLFEHTLALVKQAERFIDELPESEQRYFHSSFNHSSLTRFGLVKLACLFHDLGKPDTKDIKQTPTGERFTYYGHDQVSAEYTEKICNRLKTGNAIKAHLMHLTRWHLYPCQFGKQSPRKSVLRFYRRMGDATPDVILLALADRFSTLGPDVTQEILQREHENLLWLLENYRLEMASLKQPLLLNGHEIMQALEIAPGPKLKEILLALEEAQQLGEVSTKEAALDWLHLHYYFQY